MAPGMTAEAAEAASLLKPLKRLREKLPFEAGNYPYVVARVKAKKTLLLPRDTYAKMLQMEIPSIARMLGDGEYRQQVVALGARYSGVDLIERATSENLARVFTQIYEFCEGQLQAMIGSYLDRWDVNNIKTILRGKLYGATPQEITEDLVPAGSLPAVFLQQLVQRETLAEIAEALEGTVYHEPLIALGGDVAALKDLAAYEDALAKAYYRNLLESIPPSTEAQVLFRLFVRKEIDNVNVKTLLRLWASRTEVQRDVFLDGGLETTPAALKAMTGLDLAALQGRLSEFSFYEAIAPLLPQVPERGVGYLERELEKLHLREASKHSHQHPLSVLPVLDYIVAKEVEVQNIRIIARGKAAGLTNEEIRDLLVV